MPRASQRKQTTKRGQSSLSRSNRSRSTRNEPDTRASPDKPQTSFLDFPVELRVQIYSYFLTDSLIHLRRTPDDDDSHQTQFIWRACRTPDPRSPLLCAYPTWSTICGPKDRCGDKTQNPTTFPILLTCKTIYKEIKPMIFSHVAISLDCYLDAFVENTTTSVLNTLRRVTLSGYHSLPCRKAPPITTEDGRLLYPGMGLAFHCLLQRLPHLEEIAFQGKIHEQLISTYDSSRKQHALMHKRYFRDLEIFKNCFLLCGLQVTVVFDAETMMGYGSGQEKVGKFTLIRKGKGEEEAMERNGWADRDVVVWREMGSVLTAARREIWGSKMKCDLYG